MLLNMLCLKGHDGLKHTVVGGDTIKSDGSGFISHQADKLGEINLGRTAYTALGAGQAVPEGAV